MGSGNILAAAENLSAQGDYDAAWLALEELEPLDWVMPEVIEQRLRICTSVAVDNQLFLDSGPGIEKWEVTT